MPSCPEYVTDPAEATHAFGGEDRLWSRRWCLRSSFRYLYHVLTYWNRHIQYHALRDLVWRLSSQADLCERTLLVLQEFVVQHVYLQSNSRKWAIQKWRGEKRGGKC